MSIKNFEVYAEKASYGRYVKVWLNESTANGGLKVKVCQPVMTDFVADGEEAEPALDMDTRTAQNLLDALWRIGLRPNNGEGMDAQVDALKAHLEDMRTLVFKKPC